MHPEWRAVNRLLVIYCGDVETFDQLMPALQQLDEVLSNVEITVLTIDRLQYSTSSRFKYVALEDWQIKNNAAVKLDQTLHARPAIANLMSEELIQAIESHHFGAAIIFTNPCQSPYLVSYLCYLAGIPIRVGQSREFGGSVLSHCVQPPAESISPEEYHRHLLQAAGVVGRSSTQPVDNFLPFQLKPIASTA